MKVAVCLLAFLASLTAGANESRIVIEQNNHLMAPLLATQGLVGAAAIAASHYGRKADEKRFREKNAHDVTLLRKQQEQAESKFTVEYDSLLQRYRWMEIHYTQVKREQDHIISVVASIQQHLQVMQNSVEQLKRENKILRDSKQSGEANDYARLMQWLETTEAENRKCRTSTEEQIRHLNRQNSLLKDMKTPTGAFQNMER